jgi:hypothetical protein
VGAKESSAAGCPSGTIPFMHVNVRNTRLEGQKSYLLANFELERAEGHSRSRRKCPWVLNQDFLGRMRESIAMNSYLERLRHRQRDYL